MAENIILTKDQLREFWPISKNINEDRLNPYILRAQQRDLKPFLGEAFYYDFVKSFAHPNNVKLFIGGEFEVGGSLVYFSGVKALLSCFAYSRFLADNPISVSRAGNKNKTDDNSVELDSQTTRIKSNEAKGEAIRIQVEVERFLNKSKTDYPLWQKGVSLENPQKSGFSITKVPRSIQR